MATSSHCGARLRLRSCRANWPNTGLDRIFCLSRPCFHFTCSLHDGACTITTPATREGKRAAKSIAPYADTQGKARKYGPNAKRRRNSATRSLTSEKSNRNCNLGKEKPQPGVSKTTTRKSFSKHLINTS